MDKNAIAKCFREAFNSAFNEQILPGKGTFLPSDAQLYVSERAWKASDYTCPTSKTPYEDLLNEQFWDDSGKKLVVLIGEAGIGKSTLVNYFLRSHCPSTNSHRYDHKLILNVRCRGISTAEQFDNYFFPSVKLDIESAFRRHNCDLTSLNDYAIWDDLVGGWDSPHHATQQRIAGYSAFEYRGLHINSRGVDDRTFVNAAFQFLGKTLARENKLPFRYLVLCLDDLDQSDTPVLEHVVTQIRQWLYDTHGDALWRIYLPAWPETFVNIQHSQHPLPDHDIIQVGPPKHEKVLQLRCDASLAQVQRDGRSVAVPTSPDGSGPIETFSNSACQEFIRTVFATSRPRILSLLELLASDSMRRLVALWRQMLSSNSLARQFANQPNHSSMSNYALLDGLLTGYHSHHQRDSNAIANLFYADIDVVARYPLLLGIHLAQLLRRSVTDERELEASLVHWGYEGSQIQNCIKYFREKEMLRRYSHRGVPLLDIDGKVVAAHLNLLFEPAYIDAIAIVTPVDDVTRASQSRTFAFRRKDFTERVRSSLAFLALLRNEEEAFWLQLQVPNAPPAKRSLVIPERIFNHIATSYRTRIETLSKRSEFLSEVPRAIWNEFLSHPGITTLR
ncbi:hypothetical protein [Lacipirellula sp.]|uniref:hypothetical protein n=1 Tax=Lacipirellula sp. TaxID=2691419 RepID=UPI003D0E2785